MGLQASVGIFNNTISSLAGVGTFVTLSAAAIYSQVSPREAGGGDFARAVGCRWSVHPGNGSTHYGIRLMFTRRMGARYTVWILCYTERGGGREGRR